MEEVTTLMSNLTSTLQGLHSLIQTIAPQAAVPLKPALLGDVVAEFLEAKARAGLRARYISQLRCSQGHFLNNFGADTPISSITALQIEEWLHSNKSWKNRTKLNYLVDVRTLFAFALRRKYVRHNVALDVEKPVPEPQACGILPLDELWRVLEVARLHGIGPYVGVMLFAGLRPAEVDRLTAEDFKGESIVVAGSQSKTRKRRVVPILPALRTWLDFCGPCAWPPVNRHRALKEVHAAIDHWPHDALRNCFVSYCLPVHGVKDVARWAGHSEDVLFASYAEPVTPEDGQAFCALACPWKRAE